MKRKDILSAEELYRIPDEASFNIDESKFENAIKIINIGMLKFDDCYELAIMKAEVLMLLQRYKQAKALLDELLESEPEDPYIYFHLAHYYAVKEKNLGKAVRFLKTGLKYEPENFDLLSATANYLKLDNKPEYERYLKKAFSVDRVRAQQFIENYWIDSPDILHQRDGKDAILVDVDQTMRKVFKAFQEGDFDTALNGIKTMKSKGYVDKQTMDLLLLMEADAYLEKEDIENARETASYMIKMWPRNPAGNSALAKVEFASGNLEKALEHINEAICLGEKHKMLQPHMFVTKGKILQAMGNDGFTHFFEKADEMIKKDMRKFNDDEFREMFGDNL